MKAKIAFVAVAVLLFIASALALRQAQEGRDENLGREIDALYSEREAIDSNLRAQIVALQKKIVNLPKIFSKNKRAIQVEMIHANFSVLSTETIAEKEIINQLYSRDQRKDLFAGRVVVQLLDNNLFYSIGVTDQDGEYSGAVEKNLLQSRNAGVDFERLTAIVNSDLSEENGKVNYQEKIAILKQICIDSAFEAEKTRIEFVSNERDVAKINKKFVEATQGYNQQWMNTVLAILAGNVLFAILFVLVFFRKSSHRGA